MKLKHTPRLLANLFAVLLLTACNLSLSGQQNPEILNENPQPEPAEEEEPASEEQPVEIPPLVAERVALDPGETSTYLIGGLEQSTSKTYVLAVDEGQEMLLDLSTDPPLGALLTLFGDDGRVLLSDHGDSMGWMGKIPLGQDYYVTVSAGPDEAIDFYLRVVIPPVGESLVRGYKAMEYNACKALSDEISQLIGVPAYLTSGLFEDHHNNSFGGSCKISAWGSGVDFPDWGSSSLEGLLDANGWIEDSYYAAGGVGGSVSEYRLGTNLCILTREVRAASRDLCPADQPISACWAALLPEEMIYSIELNCATSN